MELKLTPDEVDKLEDYEIEAYYKVWRDREERTDSRIATVISTLGNIVFASQGGKANLKPSDFLSVPEKVKPRTADELRNLAILAFGPPPKNED